MSRRAWWLVGLNILMPGTAQVVAGNRRLGRVGLVSTWVLWALLLVGVALALFGRTVLVDVATNVIALTVLQVVLVYYLVLWIVLTIDTLRLARLVRASPGARPLVAGVAVVSLVLFGGVAGYGAFSVVGPTRDLLIGVFSGGDMAQPVDGKYNILLLGGDAGSSRVGLRPDSISVVSIDAATGATTIVGIPRNLQRVPFPEGSPLLGPFPNGYDCGVECLIDYLYTYGEEHPVLYPDAVANGSEPGIEAMRDAAAGVTGLTIQYYVLIDMGGFSDLINALGGVTIDVKQRLPIGGHYDESGNLVGVTGWIRKGEQHMGGYKALWYARSRETTSDYDRMRRQREVQSAILQQFSPGNVLTKFQGVASAGGRIVKTDIPQGMLGGFAGLAEKARQYEVTSVELVPSSGVDVVVPDYDQIHAMVQDGLSAAVTAASGED
jgi:LCP family protein required for cell wall assembly